MAQHIDITKMPQKIFKTIATNIAKDVKRGIKGSLKYQYDRELSNFYRENEDEEVAMTERYIGKGFIYGSERGTFEVHYNPKLKVVNQIYLVA